MFSEQECCMSFVNSHKLLSSQLHMKYKKKSFAIYTMPSATRSNGDEKCVNVNGKESFFNRKTSYTDAVIFVSTFIIAKWKKKIIIK
jgi:hypothetical protein